MNSATELLEKVSFHTFTHYKEVTPLKLEGSHGKESGSDSFLKGTFLSEGSRSNGRLR